MIEGWPIFASFGDLASQTQRMASDKAKQFYKSSGLPKRASINRASSRKLKDNQKRMRSRSLERKGMNEKEIKEWFRVHTNDVVLNEDDIIDRGESSLDEVIIDNWKIKAWYVADAYQAAPFFLKHLPENKITKPVYVFDTALKGGIRTEVGTDKYKILNPENPEDVETLLEIFQKAREG